MNHFSKLLEALATESIDGARAHPLVGGIKFLTPAEASQLLRDYRTHVRSHGSVVKTHGAGAHIGVYMAACTALEHADLSPAFLLEQIGWPEEEGWNRAMLSRAARGELTPDQTVAALASEGFAREGALLMPFGSEPWAFALRAEVASWSGKRQTIWAELVTFCRSTDIPLRPTEGFLSSPRPKKLLKSVAPLCPALSRSLQYMALPPQEEVFDPSRDSRLTRGAEENARMLHTLVFCISANLGQASRELLNQVSDVAFASLPGLGPYLPKLGHRCRLALEGLGS